MPHPELTPKISILTVNSKLHAQQATEEAISVTSSGNIADNTLGHDDDEVLRPCK